MTNIICNKIQSLDRNCYLKVCKTPQHLRIFGLKAFGLGAELLLSGMMADPVQANPFRPVVACVKSKPCVSKLKQSLQRGAEFTIEQLLNIYDAFVKLSETQKSSNLLDQLDKLEREIEKDGKMTAEVKMVLVKLRTELADD